MTLEEAIAHAREVAEDKRADADWKFRHGRLNADDCISCAEEHEQLAEWLEELKSYRVSVFSGDMTQAMLKEEYCKAVDDFVKLVKEHNWNIRNRNENEFIYGSIDRLAERLKAGENNDNLRR